MPLSTEEPSTQSQSIKLPAACYALPVSSLAWMYSFSQTQEKRHLWLALLLLFCEVRGGLGDWQLLLSSAGLSFVLFSVESWAGAQDWRAITAGLTPRLPPLPRLTLQLPGHHVAASGAPLPSLPAPTGAALSEPDSQHAARTHAAGAGGAMREEERQLPEAAPDLEVLVRQQEEAARQLWDRRMQLRRLPLKALREVARQEGISGRSKMNKRELVEALEAAGVHREAS